MRRPDNPSAVPRAREMRKIASPIERRLWSRLRGRQLDGWKFRRQVWLGPFVVDFFCAEAKLIVEVDGDEHGLREKYDERRSRWLHREGFRVVRFSNSDVMSNLEGVLEQLRLELPSPSQPPSAAGPLPLPSRERAC